MLDLARSSRWTRFWIILSIVGGLYLFYMSYFAFFTASTESIVHPTTIQHRCQWKEGDPVVYHLKTKMGVNYDAGHWFHMAENFMVQHSILRKAGELTNSSNIILNFDEDHFINELNGITRLIVYLGTHNAQSTPKHLYFTHLTFLPWQSSHARVGSSVVLNHHDFNEVQMMDLQHNAEIAMTENRFVNVENYHLWPSAPHSTGSSGGAEHAVPNAFRRLQNNNTTTASSMNLRASVVNANLSTHSASSADGAKGSNSVSTSSTGAPNPVPNRVPSTTDATRLAAARSIVTGHAHNSGSLTAGIPSASITTSASSSIGASASGSGTISTHAGYNSHHQVCARYMGSIGGTWPTVQRGHWFPNPGDIGSFRDTLRTACPADPQLLKQTAKKKKYKMVLYQRDLSRKLANQEEAVAMIRGKLSETEWDIEILMHKTSRSPCTLMHHLYNTDILLTPHGFQSMLLLFLPRPGLMFEIFPEKYYKRGYGPFGAEYGVTHGGTMSPSTGYYQQLVLPYVSSAYCMESKFCRGFARNQDVILTTHGVNNLLAFIEEHQGKLQVPAPSVDTIVSHLSSGNKKAEKSKDRDFLFY